MKYKLNSADFLKKVITGRIEDLNKEQLEIFSKILPKAHEVQKLTEKVI